MPDVTLAFDLSTRRVDADGRLHVEINNITKANVCDYAGSEIPNGPALGLDMGRTYKLLRDPAELKRAVSTANNIQLLRKHVGVSAESPQHMDVVGSTGTDARWSDPYVQNSIVVWDAVAIAGVETEEQCQLSSSYAYRADMTPGNYKGVEYHGVMRDIVFNHVALVEVGRAGSDVIVGDSLSKEPVIMRVKRKAAAAAFASSLDAQVKATEPLAANDAALRPALASYRKLAMDAAKARDEMDDEEEMDAADEMDMAEKKKDAAKDKKGRDKAKDEDPDDDTDEDDADNEKLEKAKSKMDDVKDKTDEAKEKVESAKDKKASDKKAMDSAVAAITARLNGVRDAERAVRPYVGDLTLAYDSADEVYRFALEAQGIKTKDVHPSAFPVLLEAVGKRTGSAPRVLAADSVGPSQFLADLLKTRG